MAKFSPKKWRNPGRILRSELTSTTRDLIERTEGLTGLKCQRLHEVKLGNRRSEVRAEFRARYSRNTRTVTILTFSPQTGYSHAV